MEKIIKFLIVVILLFLIGFFIYINFDDIKFYVNKFITKHDNIIIPESNQYKRDYKYERFTNEEDYIPHSFNDIENIFYNILNNGWNEFVFYCPQDYEECTTDVETISSNEEIMGKISGYVSPYNSHQIINTTISSYGEIYINVTKKYSEEEINSINNEIVKIYNDLNLSDKTLEEKIKAFHDYLIKNTSYDEVFAETNTSIYKSSKANGALLEHYAVCGGYAEALSIFLDYIKIPNIIISNKNHAWNLVFINGKWLHIDPTWNDTEIERFDYEFYLIDNNKLLEIDEKEHTFDNNFFIEAN